MTRRPMKPRFTAAQHHAYGDELHAMRSRLIAMCVEAGNAYPKRHPFPAALARALDALDVARSEGDGALAAEHPGQFAPSTYYPAPGPSGTALPSRPR